MANPIVTVVSTVADAWGDIYNWFDGDPPAILSGMGQCPKRFGPKVSDWLYIEGDNLNIPVGYSWVCKDLVPGVEGFRNEDGIYWFWDNGYTAFVSNSGGYVFSDGKQTWKNGVLLDKDDKRAPPPSPPAPKVTSLLALPQSPQYEEKGAVSETVDTVTSGGGLIALGAFAVIAIGAVWFAKHRRKSRTRRVRVWRLVND